MSIRTFRVHPVAVVSITACLRHAVAGGNQVSAFFDDTMKVNLNGGGR
jgi:hypothetical protein